MKSIFAQSAALALIGSGLLQDEKPTQSKLKTKLVENVISPDGGQPQTRMELPSVPTRLTATAKNAAVCRALGVKFDGHICPRNVKSYDLETGKIEFLSAWKTDDFSVVPGMEYSGKIEVFWREDMVMNRQTRRALAKELEKL